MDEELNLDHFDLGTFVDYVHALKQERDALRAQLPSQGGEAVAWVHPAYLKPGALGFEASVCRLSSLQVPLYTHPADQVAEPDAELVALMAEVRKRAPLPDWARIRIDAKLAEVRKCQP